MWKTVNFFMSKDDGLVVTSHFKNGCKCLVNVICLNCTDCNTVCGLTKGRGKRETVRGIFTTNRLN